jgi:hypothetical protein
LIKKSVSVYARKNSQRLIDSNINGGSKWQIKRQRSPVRNAPEKAPLRVPYVTGKEDSPAVMQRNDLVHVVMVQGKESVPRARVLKENQMANRNMCRLSQAPVVEEKDKQ